MNLGVRAHDFGKTTLEDFDTFATGMASKGFSCTQLALQKAIEGFSLKPGFMNPGLGNLIRKALAKNGMHIAVLGCYINPVHPDRTERQRQMEAFKDCLKYSRDFGASVVGTETGSLNPDCSYHPGTYGEDVYRELIGSVEELVETAEKFGSVVALEAVANQHTIHTVERMRRVIDDIRSPNLQVIFDPVNLVDINAVDQADDMIRQAFDRLGDRMAAFHLKDFVVAEGKKKAVSAGQGNLNSELFFRLAKQARPGSAFLLEDSKPDTFDQAIAFSRALYHRV